jgi:DNA-binding SARP family transcriptional activator
VLGIYLAGRMTLIRGEITVSPRDLPGTLARCVLAALVLRRSPLRRSELAEMVHRPDASPDSWDATLNSTVSRLRSQLGRLGLDGREWIQAIDGTIEFCRPEDVVVDVESARSAIDRADVLWRGDEHHAAWSEATVAYSVASRPFLPGVSSLWAEQVQHDLDGIRHRALTLIIESCLLSGDVHQAQAAAQRLVRDDRFSEESHRLLIRAHLAAGDRARAKRALDDLERLMGAELGVSPSATTISLLASA